MSAAPATAALGEERVPPDEAAAIDAVLRSSLDLMDTRSHPVPRAQHAKHHGCVQAELSVGDDVPQALRHGLFAAPGTYAAIVRFSNGGKWDDRKRDAHGMAVKISGLDALGHPEQDFVMVDSPVFFLRNAADYARFAAAMRSARCSPAARLASAVPKLSELVAFLILYARFFRNHRRELRLLKAFAGHRPDDPLTCRYWSTTPYRLGPHAIRFSARPVPGAAAPAPAVTDSPDRLREAMKAHLERHEARFDFLVQRQTDPVTMPVEDPTVAWDEDQAPYLKVASLRIPPQSFDDEDCRQRCEAMSFQPWHALPEHRPLGGINRVRRVVYQALYERRRTLSEARSPHEPGAGGPAQA